MENDVSIQVGKDIVKPIVEAKITAAIVAELANIQPRLIEEMITKLLHTKVDRDGKPSNYSHDTPFMEWIVRDGVINATREALNEIVATEKPKIKRELMRVLRRQNATIAENFIAYLESNTKERWKTNISVTFSKPTE